MNTEELSESLRTEINTRLKNAVADLQQEIVGMQERMNAEIERHRGELRKSFDELLARGVATNVDDEFTRLIAEHVQIAFEDGKKAAQAESANALQVASEQSLANYSAMRDAINDVSSQPSQAEILKALVNHSSRFAPRGAFFIVKSDHLVGWRTFGSELENNIDSVREIFLPLNDETLLSASVKQNAVLHVENQNSSEDTDFLHKLNFSESTERVAIPLVVRNRGVAVLYADAGENNSRIDLEALEALMRVAGLTVELLAAAKAPASSAAASAPASQRSLREDRSNGYAPATLTSQENVYQTAAFANPTQADDESVRTIQTATFAEQPSEVNGQVEVVSTQSQNGNGHQSHAADDITKVEFSFDSQTSNGASTNSFTAETMRTETTFSFDTAQPATTSFSPSSSEGGGWVETKSEVPKAGRRLGERNLELPIDVPEEERRLHNDARRFARLLVSEIKLYNEQKVREGRQAGDLYSRLREAVDRSREMYNKRVAPPVAAKFDYFNYELVSTLAEGDEAKLGNEYPGATA